MTKKNKARIPAATLPDQNNLFESITPFGKALGECTGTEFGEMGAIMNALAFDLAGPKADLGMIILNLVFLGVDPNWIEDHYAKIRSDVSASAMPTALAQLRREKFEEESARHLRHVQGNA